MAEVDGAPEFVDEIRHVIGEGIVSDIYRVEEAIKLFEEIGKHTEFLTTDAGFNNLAATIQNMCILTVLLGLARIYDRVRAFDLRNLVWLVARLSDRGAGDHFPNVVGFDERVSEWRTRLAEIQEQHGPCLKKIRTVRDKQLAHNELVREFEVNGPTWGEVDELLQATQSLTGDIGFILLNTAYTDDRGDWGLSFDAQRASMSMRRIFEVLAEYAGHPGKK